MLNNLTAIICQIYAIYLMTSSGNNFGKFLNKVF